MDVSSDQEVQSLRHSRFLLHGQRLVAARARGPKRHGGTWRVQVARSLRKAQDSTPARVRHKRPETAR